MIAHDSVTMSLQRRLLCVLLASTALFGFVRHCSAAQGPAWGYDDTHGLGPSRWAEQYTACGGYKQSPINIELANATRKDDFAKLELAGHATGFELTNNGHTVMLSVKSGAEFALSGGGLPGTYKLVQFHFHWGKSDDHGSEHFIDGKKYPLEIHFVHYNKKYSNIGEALGHDDGLAVLGVFAEVGEQSNDGMEYVVAKFADVKYKNEKTNVDDFTPGSLMPLNKRKDFARYQGSLTTPGCNQSVIWTVFTNHITISSEQMQKFRSLKLNERGQKDEMLADNFRPVQALNERTVYVSYGVDSAETVNNGRVLASLAVSLLPLAWQIVAH